MKTLKFIFFSISFFYCASLFASEPTNPTVPPPPIPSNDLCANAITLTLGTGCDVLYDETGATATAGVPAPGCGGSTFNDVWFKFVVPPSGHVIITTTAGTMNNDAMAIYSGTCGSLTLIECKNNGNGNMAKIDRTGLTPGSTIYIRLWGESSLLTSAHGNFKICVKEYPLCGSNPIAADLCNNATPICNFNGYCGKTDSSYSFHNSQGQDENGTQLGSIFCGSIENNSWLKFLAEGTTATFDVYVSNCTDGFGIQMEIYGTTDCLNFTSHSNCWNPGSVQNGTMSATGLTPGQIYYLMIDGNSGDVCDYLISATSGVATVDAGRDTSICSGGHAQLDASGGTIYAWLPTTGLSDPNIPNPIASPTVTTTYTVYVSSGNSFCPPSMDTVTVYITTFPRSATNNSPICEGTPLNLIAHPDTATSYSWSGPNGYSGVGQTATLNPATGAATGNYIVTITLSNGCQDTAQTSVTILGNSSAVAGNNSPICVGETLNLTSSGGTNYNWSGPNSFSTTTQNPTIPNATTTASGVYIVTVTPTNGCSGTVSTTVTINPPPILSVTPPNPATCYNVGIQLNATGADTYIWKPDSTLSAYTGSPVTATPHGNITYTLVGTLAGCKDSIQIPFVVNPLPTISIIPTPPQGCVPLYVSFAATSTPAAQNYAWNLGNSTTSTLPNPNTLYYSSGQYSVSVTITDINGCVNSKNYPNLITAHPKPTVNFSISPIDVGYVSDEIVFSSTYSGSNSNWIWNFGDGTSVTEQDPIATHHYGMAGVLNVTHIVINEFGCSDTITKPYTVFTKIIIPNILTPNNDGLNDTFIIDGLQFLDGARLKVYNRWGRKIYDNSSYKNDWNGENAPDGVYFYTLTLPDFLKAGPYSGSVTLLR